MGLPDIIAALMFLGVVAYAVFGGADFGSGVWDLTAGDSRQGSCSSGRASRSRLRRL